jgi:hypothetical protein
MISPMSLPRFLFPVTVAVVAVCVGIALIWDGAGTNPATAAPTVEAAAAPQATTSTVYPRAITSDSILWGNRGTYYGRGWWVDVESERQAYTRGAQGKRSHWEAVKEIAAQVTSSFVVVDNAWGVTDAEWEMFIRDTAAVLDDDVCLVFVAPVFHPDWGTERASIVARRAAILRDAITDQPCHMVIPWDHAVARDKSLVTDGQHPSAAGALWLQRAIIG